MRYHIFGDTGGHYNLLSAGLESIGWDKASGLLPADVTVVHLGDLIHKGPNSPAVLELVERVRTLNPGRWVQLFGNHELNYVMDAPSFWRNGLPSESVALLGDWIQDGFMQFAFALPADGKFEQLTASARPYPQPEKGVLLTHSGLTHGFWADVLDRESDAAEAAKSLNSLPVRIVSRAGSMLYGGTPEFRTGPAWASSIEELWQSWALSGATMPFIQVHGHTAPFSFDRGSWWIDHKPHRATSKVNAEKRRTMTQVADSLLIAVDPAYEKKQLPAHDFQPSLAFQTS